MTYEELKEQYEEDCKNHERPWEFWEFRNSVDHIWTPLPHNPGWVYSYEYRRKEPPFQPEYFSGLNWREAEKLVGKVVEFSNTGDVWIRGGLNSIVGEKNNEYRYETKDNYACYTYIRTCPETFRHTTITIGGVELPRPEVEEPERGTPVWAVNGSFIKAYTWSGNWNYERCDLEDRKIHLTKARAQAWAKWWENTIIVAIKASNRLS